MAKRVFEKNNFLNASLSLSVDEGHSNNLYKILIALMMEGHSKVHMNGRNVNGLRCVISVYQNV